LTLTKAKEEYIYIYSNIRERKKARGKRGKKKTQKNEYL
jgi:hypothetical protein